MAKVFVYGTLRKDGVNPCCGYGGKYLHGDSVNGTLFDLGAFPGWYDQSSTGVVLGDVYEVDKPTLDALDAYESEGTLYDRITVRTDRNMEVFIYRLKGWIITGHRPPVVPSGDWLHHLEQKQQFLRG